MGYARETGLPCSSLEPGPSRARYFPRDMLLLTTTARERAWPRREISAAQAPRKWHRNLSTFTFSLWHVIDDEFFQCLISILGISPSSDITEIWPAYSHRNAFPALVRMTALRRIVFENNFAKLGRSRRSSCSFWRHFFRVLVDLSESSEPTFCGQVSKHNLIPTA